MPAIPSESEMVGPLERLEPGDGVLEPVQNRQTKLLIMAMYLIEQPNGTARI